MVKRKISEKKLPNEEIRWKGVLQKRDRKKEKKRQKKVIQKKIREKSYVR